jgi:hypothetical protein
VACQLTQNGLNVGFADPCQTTVGAAHRGKRIDDDLQLRCDQAGVGVGEQSLGCRAQHAPGSSSATPVAVRSLPNRRHEGLWTMAGPVNPVHQ